MHLKLKDSLNQINKKLIDVNLGVDIFLFYVYNTCRITFGGHSMSRSYRHTPIIKDNTHKGKKPAKRIANKIVRARLKNIDYTIADGTSFKKEYCSYNIADYVCRWTREDAIKYYEEEINPNNYKYVHKGSPAGWAEKRAAEFKEKYPTLEDWLIYWEKRMLKK